jgi:branched-subunit amino acid ABC-type transport system permease component
VLHLAHGDVVVAAVLTAVLGVLGTTPVAVALGPGPAIAVRPPGAGRRDPAGLRCRAARGAAAPAGRRHGRPGDALGWVAGGVAAGLLLREGLGLLLPQEGYAVPDPLRLDALTGSGFLALPGGRCWPRACRRCWCSRCVAGVLTERLLVRSRFGKALRAVADDPGRRGALRRAGAPGRAAGLRARRPARRGWPGSWTHPVVRASRSTPGSCSGLAGIAAALLGGLGSPRGALVGGLALGPAPGARRDGAGRARWTDVVPLAVLVLLLAVRPEGLRRRAPVLS